MGKYIIGIALILMGGVGTVFGMMLGYITCNIWYKVLAIVSILIMFSGYIITM